MAGTRWSKQCQTLPGLQFPLAAHTTTLADTVHFKAFFLLQLLIFECLKVFECCVWDVYRTSDVFGPDSRNDSNHPELRMAVHGL